MEQLVRLKCRLDIQNQDALLMEILNSAQSVILSRRFPFGNGTETLENGHKDLQIRIAIEMYNRIGAEGQTSHSENGISRGYGSDFVSDKLLGEIVPKVGVL